MVSSLRRLLALTLVVLRSDVRVLFLPRRKAKPNVRRMLFNFRDGDGLDRA